MRAAPVISLVLSLALGAGAIVLGRFWLTGKAPASPAEAATVAAPARPEPPKTRPLLAATRDLAPGETLGTADIARTDWRADDFPTNAITSRKDLETPEGMVWQVMQPIPAGAPVSLDALALVEPLAILSKTLEPGRRAVSLNVTEVSGVAGFVLPGDRVDLFITLEEVALKYGRPVLGTEGELKDLTFSNILVEDARVIAVDQSFDPLMSGAVRARTLTLDVPAADAQRVALAAQTASLALVLRPREKTGAEAATAPPEPPVDYRLLNPVELLAGAAPQTVATPRSAPRRTVPAAPARPKSTSIRIIEGEEETTVTAPLAREKTP